ncbi:MAG: hypothetical protein AAFY15_08850 [Cyanobacteria bacterium J06648_11]
MSVDLWFLVAFVLVWIAGPGTQALFLIAPKLHHKIGLSEEGTFKSEFRWFLLDERAIATADMTQFVSGVAFIWLALLGNQSGLIYGVYACACYVYVSVLAVSRWYLLRQNQLSPLATGQLPFYVSYMLILNVFGLYGLYYLWGLALS